MMIQKPHNGGHFREGIWVHCEQADTSAVTAGDAMMWDVTNNEAVSGIMRDTHGLRVKRATGSVSAACFIIAGAAEHDAPATAAGHEGQMILVQCYGLHPGVLYGGTSSSASNDPGEAWLVYSGTTASFLVTRQPSTVGLGLGFCGVPLATSATDSSYARRKAWLRCM